jgi:hypothetical protein
MTMSEVPERRKARRIEIRLPVVYRGADGKPIPATTENVSRRGMLLVIRQPAVRGGPIRVAFSMSDGRDREVSGEVMRTTPEGKIGIEVPESDAETLEEVIRWSTEPPAT